MDCMMCDGTTVSRTQPKTVERAGRVAVIRDVPVEVCDSCGEVYLRYSVASRLDQLFRGTLSGNVDQVCGHYVADAASALRSKAVSAVPLGSGLTIWGE